MDKRPIRVLHVLPNLNFGGLQTFVLELIKELEPRQLGNSATRQLGSWQLDGKLPSFEHTAVVLSAKQGPLQSAYESVCQVELCDYPRGQRLRFFWRLTRLLRRLQPDVVIAHLFGNHALVSWAAWLARVPATYGVSQNDPIFFARSRWQPMLLAQLGRPVCKGEIAVSESVGTILTTRLGLPARRIRVIPNACRVEEIAARAAAARNGAGETRNNPPRALMVAAIGRGKDHATALRAIAELNRRGRRVELWLAGNPFREANRTRLEALVAELGIQHLVRFLGGRKDVAELMGTSDLVVHISDSEGFSIAVIEAMAAGVPIIASDIPPCREALDGGRCGLLVPQADVPALANAICRVLDDESLRRGLVAMASERVSTCYDIRLMATRYAELLRR